MRRRRLLGSRGIFFGRIAENRGWCGRSAEISGRKQRCRARMGSPVERSNSLHPHGPRERGVIKVNGFPGRRW